MRLKVHPALCVGHGVCRRFAPTVYHLDEEGHLAFHRLEVPPGLERDAEFGATACPERAISIVHTDLPAPAAGPRASAAAPG